MTKLKTLLTKRTMAELILALGVIIRGSGLTMAAIWYDEAWSLEMTRLPLLEMIRLQATDFNPPLWEMILWPLTRLAGESVVALRLPALVASVAALWVFWLIMDELEFSDNQRLLASLLAGLLPGHFLVAQDARVYAVYSLLYMAAILFALRGRLLGLAAVTGLMLYSHATAGALVAGAFLLAWYRHPSRLRDIILCGVGVILAWSPWIPALTDTAGQFWTPDLTTHYLFLGVVQSVWASSLTPQWTQAAYYLMLFYGAVGIVVTISVSWPNLYRLAANNVYRARAAAQMFGLTAVAERIRSADPPAQSDADRPIAPTAIVALVPLAIMILVSLTYYNIVFYRPLLPLLLPMALWLGASTAPTDTNWVKLLWPAAWVVCIVVGLIGWRPALTGGGLDVVTAVIVKPDDVITYITGTAALPAEYHINVPHRGYILDADQHPALLRDVLREAMGYQVASLTEADPDLIFYPQDPLITEAVQLEIESYLADTNARLVAQVNYWQAAVIEVWRVPDR